MIKVGKLTDYAVLILHQIHQSGAVRQTVDGLSEATDLSSATVRKVMNQLLSAGLVVSHRGACGGYELSRPLVTISLMDAIAAIEGPVSLTECCTDEPDCELFDNCSLKEKWPSINDIIRNTLQRISVADLAHPGIAKMNASLRVIAQ